MAGSYDRVRPGPAPAAVDWLIPAGCAVAVDLAAGTGLFTRALQGRVGQVVAVEPDERMRQVLAGRPAAAPPVIRGLLGSFKVAGWPFLGGPAGLAGQPITKERVMSVRSRRLAVAGVLAATVIAVPAAALASDSGTPSGKPAPPASATGSAAALKSAARQPAALGSANPAMVAALAAQLGVSQSAAQRALDQLDALNGPGGLDPASPAFAAIAHGLGVSAARLAAALPAAKQAARPATEQSGAGK
jgi:hypothetical protein